VDHPVLITVGRRYGERDEMKTPPTELAGFQEILERKQAELTRVWRQRADIAIEKSADQMDEIQYASERDLAIRHVDRESTLLRQLKAALERIQDGSFGNWIDCDSKISPKRLAAVPWAPRCIHCQDAARRPVGPAGGTGKPGRLPCTSTLLNVCSGRAPVFLTISAQSIWG
jgi:DnaK suppressor protein